MPMKQEVLSISKDLEEVYGEIGASALYIIIYPTKINNIDNIYNAPIKQEVGVPKKVIGTVKISETPEVPSDIGLRKDVTHYLVKILKSSLDAHNITEITTKNKIMFNDTILEITSIKPSIVLGDYFVQYELQAYGERVKLSGE